MSHKVVDNEIYKPQAVSIRYALVVFYCKISSRHWLGTVDPRKVDVPGIILQIE